MNRSQGLREAVAYFEKKIQNKFSKIDRVLDTDFPEKTYDVFDAFTICSRYLIKYDRTGYEYQVYKEFLTDSSLPVPTCLSAYHCEGGVWLLLSFVGAKSLLGATLQEYCVLSKSLAQLHECLVDRAEEGKDFLKDETKKIKEKLAIFEQARNIKTEIKKKVTKASKRLLNAPKTIIHGDLLAINTIAQAGNIFFIDWETASYGACVHDLGRLLGDLKDSQSSYWIKPQWRQTILQVYYDNRDYDKKYSYKDFLADFQSACLWNYAEIVIAHLKNSWQLNDWYKANLQAIENDIF